MFWLTSILGLALSISPFVMGFASHGIALWTSLVLGMIVVVVSLIGLTSTRWTGAGNIGCSACPA